ncbi:MAG: hypothetical protein ABI230_07655 [Aestuariivirga sp.]
MREYIEYVAQTRAPHGILGLIKRIFSRWQMRKVLLELSYLADYQLRDIGLTRPQLMWLISKPSDCDLRWEIGQLSADPDAAVELAGTQQPTRSTKIEFRPSS